MQPNKDKLIDTLLNKRQLWNRYAKLCHAQSIIINLRGADLRWAYLRGVDLQGADLRGADLHGAYLRGADLHGAYLQGADLRWADLQGAKGIEYILSVERIGSRSDTLYYNYVTDTIQCGCFTGTIDEFVKRVNTVYQEGKHGEDYRATIEYFRNRATNWVKSLSVFEILKIGRAHV